MKQLNVFESITPGNSLESSSVHFWKLFIDGAARNNPGPAGVGIVIIKDNDPVGDFGFFVGSKTNNQAEYLALLIGLVLIKKNIAPSDLLSIISDSELLVKHVKGLYRVKHPELKVLYEAAKALLKTIQFDIGHVLRHNNKRADALANQGIDRKTRVPENILKVLHEHNISL